jgi:dihydrofolate reductase
MSGRVLLHVSMSLDGFTAGPKVSTAQPMGEHGERLHSWLTGNGAVHDPADREVASKMFSPESTGAVLMGRRTFAVGEKPWGDDGTFNLPCFVVTHYPAATIVKGRTRFTFVTGGLADALAQAKAAAGCRNVNVMGAYLARQCLAAGYIDEIHVNLIPILLGGGARLCEGLITPPIELERTGVVASSAATHIAFRVRKEPAAVTP